MTSPIQRLVSRTAPKRTCSVPGCDTVLSVYAHSTDDVCSACHVKPRCAVCHGRGRIGKLTKQRCYRCNGTGVQPRRLLRRAA